MATSTAFITLVQWVIGHGYFLFFLAAVLEGPLVTAAAGVAAALGYFNIALVIAISVMGDLVADTVYYAIGYSGGRKLAMRYGSYVGLTKERMNHLEKRLHHHAGKAMVFIKLSPLIPVPGLIMIGSVRVPLKKFIRLSLLITLPKSILFGLVGFYAGRAYVKLGAVIANTQNLIAFLTVVIFLAYYAYKKITARIAQEIK